MSFNRTSVGDTYILPYSLTPPPYFYHLSLVFSILFAEKAGYKFLQLDGYGFLLSDF